jgi:lysophospholipase L1-like esterase
MDPIAELFEAEKRDKIQRFRILNRYVQKGQIVLAGSSLMEQFPVYEFLQGHPLGRAVYNRGVGGFTTQELLGALDACIFDLEPEKIFINIGTNDLNEVDFQEEAWLGRYWSILEQIQARQPGAAIYLLAYYPVNELDDFGDPAAREWVKVRTNRRIWAANLRLAELARQMNCRYIDLNAGLLDERGQLKKEYSVEGVHIYGNGYRVVFEGLLPYLEEEV